MLRKITNFVSEYFDFTTFTKEKFSLVNTSISQYSLKKIKFAVILALAFSAVAVAQPRQELKVVPEPAAQGLKKAADTIRVEWVQLTHAGSQVLVAQPLEARIYFSRTPAGSDLGAYRALRTTVSGRNNTLVPFSPNLAPGIYKRRTEFVPGQQGSDMGPGVHYGIVAAFVENDAGGTDTLISDQFTVIVQSAATPLLTAPKTELMALMAGRVTEINNLTPTLSWSSVSGVPYYHVILSDEPIVSIVEGKPEIADNISVVWQAITPSTRIAYGAPDPSGHNTAASPPLTPGKTYSWMVLKNYGNHMAFSSSVINEMDLAMGQFKISGTAINEPRAVMPTKSDSFHYNHTPEITLAWTNLDTRANSYLINLFASADGGTFDIGIDGFLDDNLSANLLVWEATVPRGNRGVNDTMRVSFDAAGMLIDREYIWRVYAIDNSGAASTGAHSVSGFKYTPNTGNVEIKTVEMLSGVSIPVSYAELRAEVLAGPMQKQLAFFTNYSGATSRTFSVGTYRFAAVKDGYVSQPITITVGVDGNVTGTIYMTRPEAILFGRVLTADGSPVNLAKVTAVSEWGDTAAALTDGNGGFMLSCRAASWTVIIEKAGYRAATARRVVLRTGDNVGFGDNGVTTLTRNPHALTGTVRNTNGNPIMGARVRVLREGTLVEELPPTSQNGGYAFYLMSGTYTLTAEMPSFTMFSREIQVTGNRTQDITLTAGAIQISGSVTGRTWVADRNQYVNASIPNATVKFWRTGSRDTLTAISDATFGRFAISLPNTNDLYMVRASAAGFAPGVGKEFSTVADSALMQLADTLYAFASLGGEVRSSVGGYPLGGVDVIVYDGANRPVVQARSAVNGTYELRNIPDGVFTIGAGVSGYYFAGVPYGLTVVNGRPQTDRSPVNFAMGIGDRSIVWEVGNEHFVGSGNVRVMSPFNRTVPFNYSSGRNEVARLDGVGPGNYRVEAVVESRPEILHLSQYGFRVDDDDIAEDDEDGEDRVTVRKIYFPVSHRALETLQRDEGSGESHRIELSIMPIRPWGDHEIRAELFYRSEGVLSFTKIDATLGFEEPVFRFTPEKDGANLYYYFRVYFNRDSIIYGSDKQIFTTFVEADPEVISRIVVNPSQDGDTLRMPMGYTERFTVRAFYGSLFSPVAARNFGNVRWEVINDRDSVIARRELNSSDTFSYTTSAPGIVTVRAVVSATGSYTVINENIRTVNIPIRVTAPLGSITVSRRGEEGWTLSRESVAFRIQAFDTANAHVLVTPRWSVEPEAAGRISDGVFTPDTRTNRHFFGDVDIVASIGNTIGVYSQSVRFALKSDGVRDTVSNLRGLSLVFPEGRDRVTGRAPTKALEENPVESAAENTAIFSVTIPALDNHVYRSSGNLRMAGESAFDVDSREIDNVNGVFYIILDIPAHLRDRAARNSDEFMVARWSTLDTLTWVPLGSSQVINNGAAVQAELRREDFDGSYTGVRFALVTITKALSISARVSPHPFSPYIRPVKEYGSNAPAGTCITVNVDAPGASVSNIQVHIYNSTGKMVWAVNKLGAATGENRFWWNGRTSGRGDGRTSVSEEVWTDDFHERTGNRPMSRNGRYFVTVIVTDFNGDIKRVVKPVVLMK